jgi:hypothetical protein
MRLGIINRNGLPPGAPRDTLCYPWVTSEGLAWPRQTAPARRNHAAILRAGKIRQAIRFSWKKRAALSRSKSIRHPKVRYSRWWAATCRRSPSWPCHCDWLTGLRPGLPPCISLTGGFIRRLLAIPRGCLLWKLMGGRDMRRFRGLYRCQRLILASS